MDQPAQTNVPAAAPAPSSAPPPVTPSTPAKAGGSKIGLIVGAVLVVAALAAAGAYAYTAFVAQAPEKAAAKMLSAMQAVDTMKFDAEMRTEVKSVATDEEDEEFAREALFFPGLESGTFTLKMSGAMDATDAENQKAELSMSLDVATDVADEEAQGIVNALNEVEIIMRGVGNKFYLMGKNLPSLPDMDLGFVSDQWILFDQEEILSDLGLEDLAAEEDEKTAYELTEEQSRQVAMALFDSGLLKITGKLPAETLDNEKCTHVSYQINLFNLESFMLEWNDFVPENPISKAEMEAILEGIEDMIELDENGDIPVILQGEVWVGTKTSYLRKITLIPVLSEATLKDMRDEGMEISLALSLTLSGFNEPVTIEEPEDAKSFIDLMSEVYTATLIDTDEDGLTDSDEEWYGTDPNNSDSDYDGLLDGDEWWYGADPTLYDTDYDGYSDGDEVASGYNPAGEGLLEPGSQFDWGSEDGDTSEWDSGFNDSTLDSYDSSLDLDSLLTQ